MKWSDSLLISLSQSFTGHFSQSIPVILLFLFYFIHSPWPGLACFCLPLILLHQRPLHEARCPASPSVFSSVLPVYTSLSPQRLHFYPSFFGLCVYPTHTYTSAHTHTHTHTSFKVHFQSIKSYWPSAEVAHIVNFYWTEHICMFVCLLVDLFHHPSSIYLCAAHDWWISWIFMPQ